MSLDWIPHVANRTGRAGKVVNLIEIAGEITSLADIGVAKLERRVTEQVGNVFPAAGNEIVDRNNVMTITDEAVAEM